MKIIISSGHSKLVRGASGYLDEVDEARRVVDAVAKYLATHNVSAVVFHDDVSTSQSENLDRIVDFHNSKERDFDVSVHFNAYETTQNPMGTEVLYVTQNALAEDVSEAICMAAGFKDRGAKKRTDLAFLNGTEEPSILIETCFVDSRADADLYEQHFDQICRAIASTLAGEVWSPPETGTTPPETTPPPVTTTPPETVPVITITVRPAGSAQIIVDNSAPA